MSERWPDRPRLAMPLGADPDDEDAVEDAIGAYLDELSAIADDPDYYAGPY
jgi:hypothetical protein